MQGGQRGVRSNSSHRQQVVHGGGVHTSGHVAVGGGVNIGLGGVNVGFGVHTSGHGQ